MTAFKHVQGLLNSRPITVLSSDPRDPVALTPGHFLNDCLQRRLPHYLEDKACNLKQRWVLLQNITLTIWNNFMVQLVRRLHPRNKWPDRAEPLRPGQVVAILSPTPPKGKWPLGIIVEVYPGPDGQTRKVKVRTSGDGKSGPTTITRSSQGLCPLTEGSQ